MLVQNIISSSKYNIKCPYTMAPEGISIHNTYNDAPAKNEVSYMHRNSNQVSFHIAVDDVEAIQALPLDRNSWSCGDGNGKGNRKHISIEICYSKSGGDRFKKAEQRAAKVVAELLKRYGWKIDRVKAHKDFANKNCPHRTNMSEFKKLVEKELNPSSTGSKNSYKNGSYNRKAKVVSNGSNLNVRDGRGTNGTNVIGKFKDGQIIEVSYCLNNWFSTWSLGKEGYVSGEFIVLL